MLGTRCRVPVARALGLPALEEGPSALGVPMPNEDGDLDRELARLLLDERAWEHGTGAPETSRVARLAQTFVDEVLRLLFAQLKRTMRDAALDAANAVRKALAGTPPLRAIDEDEEAAVP